MIFNIRIFVVLQVGFNIVVYSSYKFGKLKFYLRYFWGWVLLIQKDILKIKRFLYRLHAYGFLAEPLNVHQKTNNAAASERKTNRRI